MVNKITVCGGSFDHFHKGHKEFLRLALSLNKKVLIGITSDKFIENIKQKAQNANTIESFRKRKQSVLGFLDKEKALDRTSIVKIDDLFGPTLTKNLPIGTIVVSEKSKKGADIINEKRKKLGLNLLKILICPLIKTQDGRVISSAGIRNGQMNRDGEMYVNASWFRKSLILPKDLRKKLKKPFGEVIKAPRQSDKNSYVVTVGDETSRKFNAKRINQKLSIVDFKIARKEIYSSFSELDFSGDEIVVRENNPAGYVHRNLFAKMPEIIRLGFVKRVILKITGEEDLLVLPVILTVPLNTIVYYGQPGVGLVRIMVSENIKKKAYFLASKFKQI